MRPIESLADLPFRRRPPLELLALDVERDRPDPDYTGFGHCRVESIWLLSDDGAELEVRGGCLLALHSSDLGAPAADDVELEFFLDEVAPGYSVTAPLTAFLARRLGGLRGDAGAIVLAMCNPHGARLDAPPAAGGVPVHYALGDVEAWREVREGGADRLCLCAVAWRVAGRS